MSFQSCCSYGSVGRAVCDPHLCNFVAIHNEQELISCKPLKHSSSHNPNPEAAKGPRFDPAWEHLFLVYFLHKNLLLPIVFQNPHRFLYLFNSIMTAPYNKQHIQHNIQHNIRHDYDGRYANGSISRTVEYDGVVRAEYHAKC